jgi:hypothetical protein
MERISLSCRPAGKGNERDRKSLLDTTSPARREREEKQRKRRKGGGGDKAE